MIKLKICGMRDARNIEEVASLSPDYMGFIFYKKSPRYVGEVVTLPENFPSSIQKVGVFVNEGFEVIMDRRSSIEFHFVQLHGNEPADLCEDLKDAGLKVIKAFSVDDDFDFSVTKKYDSSVDYFLFDTKGKHFGGNAKVFDWKVLKTYNQEVPFFLSGGLSPENLGMVKKLEGMNIHALDLNSGVELSPGLKNIDKIKEVSRILNSTLNKLSNDIQG